MAESAPGIRLERDRTRVLHGAMTVATSKNSSEVFALRIMRQSTRRFIVRPRGHGASRAVTQGRFSRHHERRGQPGRRRRRQSRRSRNQPPAQRQLIEELEGTQGGCLGTGQGTAREQSPPAYNGSRPGIADAARRPAPARGSRSNVRISLPRWTTPGSPPTTSCAIHHQQTKNPLGSLHQLPTRSPARPAAQHN